MKRRDLLVLGVAAFLLTLLLHMPAPLLSRPLGILTASQWSGASGTLQSGHAASISVNNREIARDVRWELRPWWLALLRLTFDLELRGDASVHARVSRAPFAGMRVSDLEGKGSVASLLALLGMPALPVDGTVLLQLPLVKFKKGVPTDATGSLGLQQVQWTLAREPLKLGDVNATFDTDDKGVHAVLGSGPGPLELTGEARLAADRSYDANLQMRPRPDADPQLRALLQSLGAPDSQGWYHLRRQGTL